jgi:hypothetical protein
MVSGFHWSDEAIARLCYFWRPDEPLAIPSTIIHYLNNRNSDPALSRFMQQSRIASPLWHCFAKTLWEGSLSFDEKCSSEQLLTALWTLAFLDNRLHTASHHMLNILDAISTIEPSHISVAVVALVKHQIMRGIQGLYLEVNNSETETAATELTKSVRAILLPDSAISSTEGIDLRSLMKNRIGDARIRILSEVLEHSTSFPLPHRVIDTVRIIAEDVPKDPVQDTYQIRLVTAIDAIFASSSAPELMHTIILSNLWDSYSYAEMHSGGLWWLDNPLARQTLKDIFLKYDKTITSPQPESSTVHRRLCAVIRGLDIWHHDVQHRSENAANEQGSSVQPASLRTHTGIAHPSTSQVS